MFGRWWLSYGRALERRPVLTKSVTCAALSFGADVVCQKALPTTPSASNLSLDWNRIGKFTILGFFYVSPCLHVWYGALARLFPGSHLSATMLRLVCDQLAFAPIFIAGFFSLALVLEGRPEDIEAKLRADWLPTMRANLTLWVPSMFVNFRYVPPQFQVLFSNCVGFFWNIYLSWATNKLLKR